MNEVDELLLEHFGVKGMHWGIRKSPEEIAKRREAKAEKFVKKASSLQTEIDILRARRTAPLKNRRIRNLREEQDRALQNAERKRQGKLSYAQRRTAVGVGTASAILAAYGTYQTLNSGNARRLITKGKAFIKGQKSVDWKVNPSLADPNLDANGIMKKVVKHINPDYGKPGTKMNCRRATYAYEMRRRGYDVAATRTSNGRGQEISGTFNALNPGTNLVPPGPSGIFTRVINENRKSEKPFTEAIKEAAKSPWGKERVEPSQIYDALSRQPDGARGELGMKFFGGGGHSMAWEKIKGQVVVFDNQTGKKYETPNDFFDFVPALTDAGVTRLDNVPLNNDFLLRWLKDA